MIEVLRADLTTLEVDAIVNAANEGLAPGGGVCGAIFRAAGPRLLNATAQIRHCDTGNAVITSGFDMRAKFIIHAVGPMWHGGHHSENDELRRAYKSAFRVARTEPSIRSIAFPAISTGIYGFPKKPAAKIAVEVMLENERDFDRIIACVFDDETAELYQSLLTAQSRGSRSSA